jgi:hypothetical protein
LQDTHLTLGPAFLLIAFIEKYKKKLTDFIIVFGRVSLLYYFLHILVIHLAAIIAILLTGNDWSWMMINAASFNDPLIIAYGYNLFTVSLIWVVVMALLYPICKTIISSRYVLFYSKKLIFIGCSVPFFLLFT